MDPLNADQVLALAPDPASAKAGQSLAAPGKWSTLGRTGRAAWGECQGSGAKPYQTQADLGGPAFHCSCPSRKSPCKHGLGLLLLLAANPAHVPELPAPGWVELWLAKRDATAQKGTNRPPPSTGAGAGDAQPSDPEAAAKREADRKKRAAKRGERVAGGLEELQTWLADLARQGLAHAKQQPAQFFDAMAARMVDAQAPGIARRLREWPSVFASGDDWASRALEELGGMQWLLNGAARLDELPAGLRASVRSAIGWTINEQELLADPGTETVADRWRIIGQRVEEDSNALRVQRTWLIGEKTGRTALCLSFAAGGRPLDVSLVPGRIIDADLTFYPGAVPLRASVSARREEGAAAGFTEPPARADISEALEYTATLLAGDPWLERSPWLVRACLPILEQAGGGGGDGGSREAWGLRDRSGATVPLARAFANPWPLLALSAGVPITIFGEWDGRTFLPLSAISEGRFVAIGGTLP